MAALAEDIRRISECEESLKAVPALLQDLAATSKALAATTLKNKSFHEKEIQEKLSQNAGELCQLLEKDNKNFAEVINQLFTLQKTDEDRPGDLLFDPCCLCCSNQIELTPSNNIEDGTTKRFIQHLKITQAWITEAILTLSSLLKLAEFLSKISKMLQTLEYLTALINLETTLNEPNNSNKLEILKKYYSELFEKYEILFKSYMLYNELIIELPELLTQFREAMGRLKEMVATLQSLVSPKAKQTQTQVLTQTPAQVYREMQIIQARGLPREMRMPAPSSTLTPGYQQYQSQEQLQFRTDTEVRSATEVHTAVGVRTCTQVQVPKLNLDFCLQPEERLYSKPVYLKNNWAQSSSDSSSDRKSERKSPRFPFDS